MRGIIEIFNEIPDPRSGNAIRYQLAEVLVIAVLAILCGMEHFTEMEMFAREQHEWLCKFLTMKHGVPSHDTFGDIFAVISPEAVTAAFVEWVESIRSKISGEVVPIDGKTIRASRDVPKNQRAVHIVSAWAASNRLVLGQVATEEKSNEIKAIPELLEMLELKGCIVTIDAIGTQTKIAEKIIERGGDYLLSVKENQAQLLDDVKMFFEDPTGCFESAETYENAHGREEKRGCVITKDIAGIDPEGRWKGLSGVAKITTESVILATGVRESATHYLIFSGEALTAAQVLAAKRAHWGIESMHWSLDISFREDMCRVRRGNEAKIFNTMRHLTLNLLNQERSSRGGVASKRRRCAISIPYRELVLGVS